MAIFFYTDFGSADVYVGQMKAALNACAPDIAVIDLLHDAPSFNVKASAHLLAALAARIPGQSIVVAVVDPGVGSARHAVVLQADGRWYVGPDNGLLSVIAARAHDAQVHSIRWRPPSLSASFHGRDLFTPFAGMLAKGTLPPGAMEERRSGLEVELGAEDLEEIIYVDHFGNAMTGLRAANLARQRHVRVGEHELPYARVYSDVSPGRLFWYENSIELVEIAANAESAAAKLGLEVGQPVAVI